MELKDKIQKIRKDAGQTQEQFAVCLFVSRTAVSKWETGRGVPGIESLKMISKIYGISLDELINTDEAIMLSEKENKESINRFSYFADAVLDFFAVLGLLLPLYKMEADGVFLSVPVYKLCGWLTVIYWIFPLLMAVCSVLQSIIIKSEREIFKKVLSRAGIVLNAVFLILLILSNQPYPAVLFFALLVMKGFFMVKTYGK